MESSLLDIDNTRFVVRGIPIVIFGDVTNIEIGSDISFLVNHSNTKTEIIIDQLTKKIRLSYCVGGIQHDTTIKVISKHNAIQLLRKEQKK